MDWLRLRRSWAQKLTEIKAALRAKGQTAYTYTDGGESHVFWAESRKAPGRTAAQLLFGGGGERVPVRCRDCGGETDIDAALIGWAKRVFAGRGLRTGELVRCDRCDAAHKAERTAAANARQRRVEEYFGKLRAGILLPDERAWLMREGLEAAVARVERGPQKRARTAI